jgi:2-C-methyl-D-erythritol 4-phosphate cytidylyltransferase/2-C-methyl-D-erythritol 2,4-cyclodiphosphate synthase
LPATPDSDTLKRFLDGSATLETVDRRELYGVQTPQVFRLGLLLEAYRSAQAEGFAGTDDGSYVERLGHPVTLVPGERNNLKITVAEDLRMAEGLLSGGAVRTGFGYDVHQLVPGRPLVLGGVALEHPAGLGLDGHSDADVLLHAIADALLGACALGDIGEHFPNTDPRYAGISSLVLLRVVADKVRESGFDIVNVDAMLLAERPKIRPHVDRMRANIAEALRIDPGGVSVKATTNERLGFEGREEGMAAHAVATVRNTTS